jgi:hypothetical protein
MSRKRTSENDLVVSGAAAPARRKAAARPRAKRAAEPVETLAPAAEQETAAPQAETAAPAAAWVPSYDEVARLAYSYWEARGCHGGCPEEDWLRAEEELRSRSASAAAA